MRLKAASLTALLLLAALGCVKTTGVGSVVVEGQTQTDLASYFKPFPAGAFVLYDLKRDRYVRYNEARCRERFSPYSTFKIPNSLIGLDTGVIPDAEFVIKWDAKKYPAFSQDTLPFSAWWQDQTLRTAYKRSVVWYYRELALKVGARRMKEYVNKLDYGNEDASGPLNGFWLNSSLKISADEQVEFLKRLYKEELPVSKRSLQIVKEIMTLEETPEYKLSGKTGGGPLGENRFLGWFVGYLETKEGTYFFATEIEGPTYISIRDERIALTKRILGGLGHLKN
ncbi:MAG TPA: penicillin-binding transpeptidase domain-containing protein [Pyrinomonadaceae bacterium]